MRNRCSVPAAGRPAARWNGNVSRTIALLWSTIGYTSGFAVTLWWVKLMFLGIGLSVTAHVLKMSYRKL
jgi:hypothetical protein